MSRLACPPVPGVPLHIVQRGRGGAACFRGSGDARAYLDALGGGARRGTCDVHAYVLMGNHVHLLVTPRRAEGAAVLLRALGEVNADAWEAVFDATPVFGARYLLACMRYIEWNPVRAGRVRRPQDYRWSSYRANALGEDDPRITPHAFYCALGRTTPARCAAYRALSAGVRKETGRAGTGS